MKSLENRIFQRGRFLPEKFEKPVPADRRGHALPSRMCRYDMTFPLGFPIPAVSAAANSLSKRAFPERD